MKHSCRMATQRTMKIPPYPPLEKGGWGDFQVKELVMKDIQDSTRDSLH